MAPTISRGVFTSPRPRVRQQVGLDEMLGADMRVDLRRGHRGMPEQFLHGAHVRTPLDEMGGERMPQRVGMHRTADVRPLPGDPHYVPYGLAGDPAPTLVEENRQTVRIVARPTLQDGPPFGQLSRQGIMGEASDRNKTLL